MRGFGISLSALACTLTACNCIVKGWWWTGCFLLMVGAGFSVLANKSKS